MLWIASLAPEFGPNSNLNNYIPRQKVSAANWVHSERTSAESAPAEQVGSKAQTLAARRDPQPRSGHAVPRMAVVMVVLSASHASICAFHALFPTLQAGLSSCRGLNFHLDFVAYLARQASRAALVMGLQALLFLPLLLAAAPAPAAGAEEPGGGSSLVPDKLERQTGTVAPVRQAAQLMCRTDSAFPPPGAALASQY